MLLTNVNVGFRYRSYPPHRPNHRQAPATSVSTSRVAPSVSRVPQTRAVENSLHPTRRPYP